MSAWRSATLDAMAVLGRNYGLLTHAKLDILKEISIRQRSDCDICARAIKEKIERLTYMPVE